MRHPFHWDAKNQKSTREKGTQYKDATIWSKFTPTVNVIYNTIQYLQYNTISQYNTIQYNTISYLQYNKHTNNAISLHLFGIKQK